jgi:hypothetical protein
MAQIATSEPDRVLRRPLSHTTASVAKRSPQVTQSTVSLRTTWRRRRQPRRDACLRGAMRQSRGRRASVLPLVRGDSLECVV